MNVEDMTLAELARLWFWNEWQHEIIMRNIKGKDKSYVTAFKTRNR